MTDNDDPDQPSIHIDLVPFGNPLKGDDIEEYDYGMGNDQSQDLKKLQNQLSNRKNSDQSKKKQIEDKVANGDMELKTQQSNSQSKKSNLIVNKVDDEKTQDLDQPKEKKDVPAKENSIQKPNNQVVNQLVIEDPKTKQENVNSAVERKYHQDNILVSKKQLESDRKVSQRRTQLQKNIKWFMTSKIIQYFLIFLIFLYTILIFATLAIDDLLSEDDKTGILEKFVILELFILFIFSVEILLTSYSQGIKLYFRDRWLLFDAIIILISIALVFLNLFSNYGQTFQSVSSAVRGIFRFLRIFLLLRKVQSFKKIKTTSKVSTHQEKIIEILYEIREQFEESKVLQDIEWAIGLLKQNKIYDVTENSKDKAQTDWQNLGKVRKNEVQQSIHRKTIKTSKGSRNIYSYPFKIIPNKCLEMFDEGIDDLKFNCFEFQKYGKGQELLHIMIYLFETYNFMTLMDIKPQVFVKFITKIQSIYRDNLYHTSLHAFDVTQTIHYLMQKCKFIEIAKLDEYEIASLYLAGCCHDVGHPGVNNAYLINTQDDLSLLYNDNAVLEMMHLTTSYELLQQDEYNILANVDVKTQKRIREIMIASILSTDMTRHFSDIAKAKGRITADDFEIVGKDKQMCMDIVVHASDISNPTKQWDLCFEWSHRIMEEFWLQGDKERERGLAISYLCDRYTTNIGKSQTGFIDFVVRPLMEILINIVPLASPIIQQMDNNSKKWKLTEDEFQERLDRLNENRQEQLFKLGTSQQQQK